MIKCIVFLLVHRDYTLVERTYWYLHAWMNPNELFTFVEKTKRKVSRFKKQWFFLWSCCYISAMIVIDVILRTVWKLLKSLQSKTVKQKWRSYLENCRKNYLNKWKHQHISLIFFLLFVNKVWVFATRKSNYYEMSLIAIL